MQAIIHETDAFHEHAKIVQRDAPFYLGQRAVDHVLELGLIEQAGAVHGD